MQVRKAWATGRPIDANVHMAGIVTLEDVIEQLIQDDIDDEAEGEDVTGVKKKLLMKQRIQAVLKTAREVLPEFRRRTAMG